MSSVSQNESSSTHLLLNLAARGDQQSIGSLLQRDRGRLRRMVELRLDNRLLGRIDPSDVVQEAQLEAAERIDEFLQRRELPFFLWLRLITKQRLAMVHRLHLGAQLRNAAREQSVDRAYIPDAHSAVLAEQLIGKLTSPSDVAIRAERKQQLEDALERMEPIDRQILTLRHFEQLSASETAHELGIGLEAAKKRHVRAIRRLKDVLSENSTPEDWT